MRRTWSLAVVVLMLIGSAPLLGQGSGQVEGRIVRPDGNGIGGVSVVISELGTVEISQRDGSFRFTGVPAGSYTLTFGLGDEVDSEPIVVTGGGTAEVVKTVDWDVSFAETITVFSASRRRERIVEAPAAITSIPEEQIEREDSHGQIPKLLEFTPGVDVAQSGVYDFNLNARGFNSSLNRRVVVLIDGRDPSVPFLGAQEWGIVSQYMNDLASAELVRGPSSALYGANAYNGVLNLVTKQPRYSEGGELRLTGGELSTKKGDFRFATELAADWFMKFNGSYLESEDFARPRTLANGVEYARFCTAAGQTNCFVPEAVPLVVDENEIAFGDLRVDKYMPNGDFFSVEGGYASAEAPAIQTGIGRFSLPDVERTWGRVNYTARHWNGLGYYNTREGNEQLAVQSGATSYLDSNRWALELQTNWEFFDGNARLVAGGSYQETEIDTVNPAGRQTLVFAPVDSDSQAVYAQVDFDLGDTVKLVLAGRYDESSLHDSQISPKAALVFGFAEDHSVRVSYNEAFQVANYSEFFLFADAAPPVNLQPFEGFCAPAGVSCGFAGPPTRVVAVGNDDLELEEVQSWELGYSGIIGGKSFLTLEYYRSTLENFITDLLPNVGTAFGRINPDFGPYAPPANLPAPLSNALLNALRGALGPSFFALSNDANGDPVIVGASYTNFGEVDTQGIDFGLTVFFTPQWRLNSSYSWFDFEAEEELPGDPLLPNAPENKATVGLAYVGDSFDAGISARWSDEFDWAVGTLFRGTVPSYETVDVVANYHVTEHIEVGLNITNVLDDEHFETFGGDLIGRRALGHIAFRW